MRPDDNYRTAEIPAGEPSTSYGTDLSPQQMLELLTDQQRRVGDALMAPIPGLVAALRLRSER